MFIIWCVLSLWDHSLPKSLFLHTFLLTSYYCLLDNLTLFMFIEILIGHNSKIVTSEKYSCRELSERQLHKLSFSKAVFLGIKKPFIIFFWSWIDQCLWFWNLDLLNFKPETSKVRLLLSCCWGMTKASFLVFEVGQIRFFKGICCLDLQNMRCCCCQKRIMKLLKSYSRKKSCCKNNILLLQNKLV